MLSGLNAVFAGQTVQTPPMWLMRQAGRYLPEYRALRQKAGGFLDLCLTPDYAADVTLQPIKRFDFDAAIIFADILLLPHALGRNLRFIEGEGPRLDPLTSSKSIEGLRPDNTFEAVYASLRQVRRALAPTKSLIGFCGAPFTVACYMVSGGRSTDFAIMQDYLRRDRADCLKLLSIIADHSVDYLAGQIAAGADIVQIFESWAGIVPTDAWLDCVVTPIRHIVTKLRDRYPQIPIIAFPRGAKTRYTGFAAATGVQAVGLDQDLTLDEAKQLQDETIVQGNLDPLILVEGGSALQQAVDAILGQLRHKPFIFNLGHGVLPHTPPEHVAALVGLVRASQ